MRTHVAYLMIKYFHGFSSQSLDDVMSTTSDLSSATDEGTVLAWRHRLFRDILERHKFSLSGEASEQIREAQVSIPYHALQLLDVSA